MLAENINGKESSTRLKVCVPLEISKRKSRLKLSSDSEARSTDDENVDFMDIFGNEFQPSSFEPLASESESTDNEDATGEVVTPEKRILWIGVIVPNVIVILQ